MTAVLHLEKDKHAEMDIRPREPETVLETKTVNTPAANENDINIVQNFRNT